MKPRGSRRGTTIMVVLGLLSIMMILTTTALVSTLLLGQELKALDKRQQQHWQQTAPGQKPVLTNSASHG